MTTIREIKQAVAARYGLAERDLDGPWQEARVVRARQVAVYLARHLTMQSLPQIARSFGERDHKTITWSIGRIEAALPRDAALRDDIAALRAQLNEETGDDPNLAHP